jgi:hypothetical protein
MDMASQRTTVPKPRHQAGNGHMTKDGRFGRDLLAGASGDAAPEAREPAKPSALLPSRREGEAVWGMH